MGSKCAPKSSVNSVRSVREKPPPTALKHSFSHRITQMNRTHSISQSPYGRQNSQNLTANFSRNALCSLYAEGVLWARNCAQKSSVNSVCSVREKISNEQTHAPKTLC